MGIFDPLLTGRCVVHGMCGSTWRRTGVLRCSQMAVATVAISSLERIVLDDLVYAELTI